jgi:hypothetical protein
MSDSSQLFSISNSLLEEINKLLSDSEPALSLSLKFGFYNERYIYSRYYLRSKTSDDKEVFFVTSDEPTKDQFEGGASDVDDFHLTALDGFEALIENLETGTFPTCFKSSVHGAPPYISYDIIYVLEDLRPRLLECLLREISGYAEDYLRAHFTTHDLERIEYWKTNLTKK